MSSTTALRSSSADAPAGLKPDLVGLSRPELAAVLTEAGVPAGQRAMRVAQLWHWIYQRGATSFDAMTTISKDLRAGLAAEFRIGR
ncbi:MAG: 23S rRNA (adenine(2503)-C(2))-methyltransferase RlmN, partial [Alphaproteobacteria bacterium]|nr:23S rRNA (adenine(2503)-C(2))-methyltransferase RlmN [Alphaproteobacteria bacterium]